jgi:DNA-binding XRE family transcriptional regulator
MAEFEELTPASAGPSGSADQGAPVPPPGLFELRPGAPDMRVGLLVVARPPDLTVLVAWEKDPGRPVEEYQEVTRLAAARWADPAVSYDAESFLDEFFPGAAAEVEIGAAALTARHRARTLAQARERMRLTQAQVAARMNVHPERVAAIEAAEPGATEIRTLAAYVRALGGRLEIVADIAGDRIPLR